MHYGCTALVVAAMVSGVLSYVPRLAPCSGLQWGVTGFCEGFWGVQGV